MQPKFRPPSLITTSGISVGVALVIPILAGCSLPSSPSCPSLPVWGALHGDVVPDAGELAGGAGGVAGAGHGAGVERPVEQATHSVFFCFKCLFVTIPNQYQ